MNNAIAVSGFERRSDICANFQYLWNRQRTFHEAVGEGSPFEVFEYDIVDTVLVANVEEGADVRVRKARNRAGFPFKSGAASRIRGQMRGQDFNRYGAVQACVACAVYLAHAPSAQLSQNLVGAELCSCGQGHMCSGL